MQYAHWLMVAAAVLVVLGFIGFALHKNDAATAEGHLETVQAAIESEREGEGEMPPKRQRQPNGIFGGS